MGSFRESWPEHKRFFIWGAIVLMSALVSAGGDVSDQEEDMHAQVGPQCCAAVPHRNPEPPFGIKQCIT
jgi:hypothetical protein